VHLTAASFPLNHNVWKVINDKHNRGGHAPDPDFGVFFGHKCIGHKLERHSMMLTVQHLQDLWIGMGKLVIKDNWHAVALNIRHFSSLIPKYTECISSQVERQLNRINTEHPARDIEIAPHVAIIEPLTSSVTLPYQLHRLNLDFSRVHLYVRLEVNPFMKGLVTWQR
jgi:hypothetical protein